MTMADGATPDGRPPAAGRQRPALAAGGRAPSSCRATSIRPSSTRRFLRQLERLLLLMRAPGPGRAEGRPAERQARPVRRVRRLSRLRPRRRPPPARLERPRPAREAVRQALHRGGGRHDHDPPRRLGLDGDAAGRTSSSSRSGPRPRSATSGSRRRTRSRSASLGGRVGPAADGPARLRPRLPAARRAVGDPAAPTARPTWSRPPATPPPSCPGAAS